MKNKEKFNHIALVNKAISLAIKIQNKGLATVFIDLSGHITSLSISLHQPIYVQGVSASRAFNCYLDWEDAEKDMNILINGLRKIANKPAIDEEKQNKIANDAILSAKKLQFERLKKELEGTL